MNEIKLQPQYILNTYSCDCLITLPKSLYQKKLWLGIYSANTQEDTKYISYHYLKSNERKVTFTHLVRGLYQFRLFEDRSTLMIGNKYFKLKTSEIFRIGNPFQLSFSLHENDSSLIQLKYERMIEEYDWIGLFSIDQSNDEIPFKRQQINITQQTVDITTKSLCLDAVKGEIDSFQQIHYHFRYFISSSMINNIPVPYSITPSFVFPFPQVSARRVSKWYIKIHFINNHEKVWCGLYHKKEDNNPITIVKDVETHGYMSLRH